MSGPRVVVLGAGFGGLELTALLAEEFGYELDLVLIDRSDGFVFGFSKLDVIFGRMDPAAAVHAYADVVKPGVQFVQATVQRIDASAKLVETDAGTFEADVLVVALGVDLDPAATPGLVESGHEFYTGKGALALREAIDDFDGGRVVIGVTSTPFKCPPAPSEMALLVHDHLSRRGLRDRSMTALAVPLPAPVPPSPDTSTALLAAFAERNIEWRPGRAVRELDGGRHVVVLDDDSELPYDLFLGVPVHRAPAVVVEAGLTVDGWIPVDPLTLETRYSGVYAIGDVTSVGTPKAGTFAEGQATTVARRIIGQARGPSVSAEYDWRGVCYIEFGAGQVGRVDVSFVHGQPPRGPSTGRRRRSWRTRRSSARAEPAAGSDPGRENGGPTGKRWRLFARRRGQATHSPLGVPSWGSEG